MNRSYSKIRHIQESNQRLERRLLNEEVPGDTPTTPVGKVTPPNPAVKANSVGKATQWKATTSYNIGRMGFDQVLNSGSIFYRVQGQPGTTASCVNPPFSQDDPLFFRCNPLKTEGSMFWLYENTMGLLLVTNKVPYYNQQLVKSLGLAFCPNGKADRT